VRLSEHNRFIRFLRQIHEVVEEIYSRGAVGGRRLFAGGDPIFDEADRALMARAWEGYCQRWPTVSHWIEFPSRQRSELAEAGLLGPSFRLKMDTIEDARALFVETGDTGAYQQMIIPADELLARLTRVAKVGEEVMGLQILLADLRRHASGV